jgi:hypothetical protein
MVMTMRITVFWDAVLCSFVKQITDISEDHNASYTSVTSTKLYGIKIQTMIIFRNY